MKITAGICALGMLCLSTVGCISQSEYDNLETAYRKAQEQIIELRARHEEYAAQVEALQQAMQQEDAQLLAELRNAQQDRDRLAAALAAAEAKLRELAEYAGPLPPELDEALEELAASNPNLMTYDAKAGMVKLRSDLTFALGSVELSPGASQSLGQLAGILTSPAAADYEIVVVGHTDNVPIRRPQTRAKHPTNWHLSVHRAISVKDALEASGVAQKRLAVKGYGSQRPIVPNQVDATGKARGAEANRRVEIFLVPMTGSTPSPDAEANQPEPVQPAAPEPAMEDDAGMDNDPAPEPPQVPDYGPMK